MSAADEKEKMFVIKHVFKGVKNVLSKECFFAERAGPVEKHHGVEWRLRLVKDKEYDDDEWIDIQLHCVKGEQSDDWSIEMEFDVFTYRWNDDDHVYISGSNYDEYTTNDEIPVEFHVTIKKMTGIEKKKLRNFDQESAGKFSDLVLLVGGQKFYVIKNFLAMHSTYFESMFFGKFEKAQRPEIELKDIDPEYFQNFLELINGESFVNDYTVEGILHLADFFGAITAIKRCPDFLLKKSKLSLKRKFDAAIKANFDDVKKQCLSSMKTKEDVKDVLPEDPAHFQSTVWAELLEKTFSLF